MKRIIFSITLLIILLPVNVYKVKASEKPKFQMVIISDVHTDINGDDHVLKSVYKNLSEIAPHYDAISVVGDMTNNGLPEEYKTFKETFYSLKNPEAESFMVMGNHEYFENLYNPSSGITDNEMRERFSKSFNVPSVYYDTWIKGYHFIALSGEKSYKTMEQSYEDPGAVDSAYFSEQQISWLERKLAEDSGPEKPIFVFLHQPIKDTVFGSIRWHAGLENKKLMEILGKYPQVILFSGHSHYILNHPKSVYQDGFTMVNTGAIAYTCYEDGPIERLSQGWILEVYDDEIKLKAREFSNGSLIRTVSIPIPYRKVIKDEKPPTFSIGSNIEVNDITSTSVTLSWQKGEDNTVIDRYLIKKDGNAVSHLYSRFWEDGINKKKIENLKPNTMYTFELYAIDAWDNVSERPLSVTITTKDS